MSDTTAPITKRKGSPEAAESTPTVHKKRKADEGHAHDCTDPACEGCADGELEIQFDHEPSAFELFQMARDEAAKEGRKSHRGEDEGDNDEDEEEEEEEKTKKMAKKLFDLAMEAFGKLEQARNSLSKEERDSREHVEQRIQHAACEVAVGVYMPALAMVEEGLAKYEQLVKIEAAAAMASAWVGLGIARISAARLGRKAILDLLEQDLDDLDEGTDEYDEAHQKAATIPKKEQELATKAIEAFDKGLGLLKQDSKDAETLFAKESIRAAQELEEYGVSIDMGLHTALARTVFQTALKYLEQARKAETALVDNNTDVLTLHGSCLFHLCRIASQEGDQDGASTHLDQAKALLTKAEEMLGENEDAKTLELLGQIYLMSTMDIEDEDEVMETYDKATAKLRRALELNPYNLSLRKQLEAIEGGEEQGEEDDEDFGDDDNDDDDKGDGLDEEEEDDQ
ncbi:hypothetical protein BGZ73_000671 [Actinomortierella ambigua]|nr:hypothetical protein BGZ73_000671 [Actinomortierella ambigua]